MDADYFDGLAYTSSNAYWFGMDVIYFVFSKMSPTR